MPRPMKAFGSEGDGRPDPSAFCRIGANVIFEAGVKIFHAERICLGSNIYFGHDTILKGYHNNETSIGDNTWIGPQCFFHGAGGFRIGARVGIGAQVKIITSFHREEGIEVPVLYSDIEFQPVVIEDDCDIGIGTIVLPGVTVGKGSIIGAGAVVTGNVEPYSVMAGVPARLLRKRPGA